MDQFLVVLLVGALALLVGRYLFPSRSPGLIEDLRGIQVDLANLEASVRRAQQQERVRMDTAGEGALSVQRFLDILLKANSDLQNQLLLCLDPLRLREGANLDLQRARLEAEMQALRHASAPASAEDAISAEAARRSLLAERLRARRDAASGIFTESIPGDLDLQEDQDPDPDPIPGDLTPAPIKVSLQKPAPRPVLRPRTEMGAKASRRAATPREAVLAAAPQAQVVEAEGEEGAEGASSQEALSADEAQAFLGAPRSTSSEPPASPLE